jgi:hypothetical protein
MNHEEVLSKLKDIHWPISPSWWPLAPGYYVVALLLVVLICIAIKLVFGAKKRQLRKAIEQEFMLIESNFREGGDVALLQGSLAALLKRLVFTKYPEHEKGASLEHMTPLIHKILPDEQKNQTLILLLHQDRFKKDPAIDAELLLNLTRRQIKRCRI